MWIAAKNFSCIETFNTINAFTVFSLSFFCFFLFAKCSPFFVLSIVWYKLCTNSVIFYLKILSYCSSRKICNKYRFLSSFVYLDKIIRIIETLIFLIQASNWTMTHPLPFSEKKKKGLISTFLSIFEIKDQFCRYYLYELYLLSEYCAKTLDFFIWFDWNPGIFPAQTNSVSPNDGQFSKNLTDKGFY